MATSPKKQSSLIEDIPLLPSSNPPMTTSTSSLYTTKLCMVTLFTTAILVVFSIFYLFSFSSKLFNTSNHIVVMVSLDGFRSTDFNRLENLNASNIVELAKQGVHAQNLKPVFPSLTFPNHYTLVTGLYPESHGIISNTFWDESGDEFMYTNHTSDTRGKWWLGEPLWSTAIRQGFKANSCFWPGSEAENHRPSVFLSYNSSMRFEERVFLVLQWLRDGDVNLINMYLSEPDSSSHEFGPDSPQVWNHILYVDQMIGDLMRGIENLGLTDTVDLIVVSDHGMATVNRSEAIEIDSHLVGINLTNTHVSDCSLMFGLWPASPDVGQQLYHNLSSAHKHLTMYQPDDVPKRWFYRHSFQQRIPPLFGLLDEGWYLVSDKLKCHTWPELGYHGCDNELPHMQALFVARGPSFRTGVSVPLLNNTDVYGIVCRALDLKPAPNNGSMIVPNQLMMPI